MGNQVCVPAEQRHVVTQRGAFSALPPPSQAYPRTQVLKKPFNLRQVNDLGEFRTCLFMSRRKQDVSSLRNFRAVNLYDILNTCKEAGLTT